MKGEIDLHNGPFACSKWNSPSGYCQVSSRLPAIYNQWSIRVIHWESPQTTLCIHHLGICASFCMCFICLSLSLLCLSVELLFKQSIWCSCVRPFLRHSTDCKTTWTYTAETCRTWIAQKRNETFRQPSRILNCKLDLYQFWGLYYILCTLCVWFMLNASSDHSIF